MDIWAEIKVKVDDKISAGQEIGSVGDTGSLRGLIYILSCDKAASS